MRLYWKLFLWLSAALLTVVIGTSWLTHQWLNENREINQQLNMLQQQAATAIELYETEGDDAYHSWLHTVRRAHRFRGFLLDGDGIPLQHEEIPENMRPLIRRALEDPRPAQITEPPYLHVIQPTTHHGERYIWIASSHIPPHLLRQNLYQAWWIRVIVSLLIVAIVSFLLSRIITRPIAKLQQASQRLGRGDLGARVLPDIGRQNDEIGELAEHFDNMAGQIEQLINRQQQLLRDVSHEIRSPLARMQLALELAMQKRGDNTDTLHRIRREAERIDRLIGDLLTLIRLENNTGQITKSALSPGELLQEIVQDASFEAEQSGKHVSLTVRQDCVVTAQAHLLQAALENIIRNAVRHTPEKQGVEITQWIDGGMLLISVCDQGPGVPDDALKHLFEPFYRVEEARDRQSGGFGIGLAIAARAIAVHHGSIHAQNRSSGGLEVRIRLPLAPSGEITAHQH